MLRLYELSRFARNRLDDAIIMADLKKRGVTLISATESIDDTPVGQLMHGILAAFSEYRSRKDGADISYKMGQRAQKGGTLGQASIGYLNVMLELDDGRKIRTVEIDAVRGPLIRTGFELYATGDHSTIDIARIMADRRLRTRRTPKRASKPVTHKEWARILRSRYYIGIVDYKGEEIPGRHEPQCSVATAGARAGPGACCHRRRRTGMAPSIATCSARAPARTAARQASRI